MKTELAPFIDRRNFLRGLGIALALPAFESLNAGFAAETPKPDPRRLICIGNHLGFWPGGFFPTAEGRDYAISKTLAPLQEYRSDFTVFSHLDHDAKGGHGAVHSFLTGVKKEESAGFPEKNISIDQVAAEHVGSATRYPSITAGIGEGTNMCWNRAGVRLPPVNNPARLFEALFVEASAGAIASERDRHIGGQLLRSGTSPAPNYAEARGAESNADFVHKLKIALKELNESCVWLKMICRAGLMNETRLAPLIDENEQLCRILNASIKTAKQK